MVYLKKFIIGDDWVFKKLGKEVVYNICIGIWIFLV